VGLDETPPALQAPSPASFGVADTIEAPLDQTLTANSKLRSGMGDAGLSPLAVWPHGVRLTGVPKAGELPAPEAVNFRYSKVWRSGPAAVSGARKAAFRSGKAAPSTARNVPATPVHKRAALRAFPPAGIPARHATPAAPVGHQLSLGKPTAALDVADTVQR
jgi:hypothetical protein